MRKKNTSKRKYISPTIIIDELEKTDILTDSAFIKDADNNTVKDPNYLGGYDLMQEKFGGF